MTELLKQPQYQPMPLAKQVISIFAGSRGYLDDQAIDKVAGFERALLRYMDQEHPEIEKSIADDGRISEDLEKSLRSAIEDFKRGYAG